MNEMIAKRRSIRKYQSDPIGRDVIERILAAGFQAPSALGKEPWEFLVVTDQKAKEYIANMSAYAWMASSAPVVILVLADIDREPQEGWLVQGVAACCENILLQITSEGLGGVWLGVYPEKERCKTLQTYFNVPQHLIPFAAIPFGKKGKEKDPINRFDTSRIHFNLYPDKSEGTDEDALPDDELS